MDLDALERQLRAQVDGEVRFDAGTRGAYATDASQCRQVPLGVVLPISQACAERVLLPAVRAARPGTAILAGGFSCRTQIEQLSGDARGAIHLAELLSPQGVAQTGVTSGYVR